MSDDEEVGYGKPPKHSRFKRGQSGNPKGRVRGTRGLKSDLLAELGATHTIHINKQPVSGTKQRLTVMTLATRAASGDIKAAQILLPLIQNVLGIDDRGTGAATLSTGDQALFDAITGSLRANSVAENDE